MVPSAGPTRRALILVPLKVQVTEEDLEFIEEACSTLHYDSRSAYLREAIHGKIEADRARIRELRRQEAMKAYGRSRFEDAFEDIAGEDFEDR
jgi:Arc/MetJ-type ribon-helix-helix transcriptional regulator